MQAETQVLLRIEFLLSAPSDLYTSREERQERDDLAEFEERVNDGT